MTKTDCYFQFECDKAKENQSCALCPAHYPIYKIIEGIEITNSITSCKVIDMEDFKHRHK